MTEQLQQAVEYFNKLILSNIPCKCWVAGGAVRDYFSIGRPLSDVDLFFPNNDEAQKAINWFDQQKAKLIFKNNKVISLSYKKHKFDIVVVKYFDTPEHTISEFDFTVCCCAIDKEKVYCHETFFMDLAKRRLVINRLPFPLSTLQRLQRYIHKGFWICNGGLLEIAKAIQTLDLNDKTQNSIEFYPDGKPRFVKFD